MVNFIVPWLQRIVRINFFFVESEVIDYIMCWLSNGIESLLVMIVCLFIDVTMF